MDEQEAAAEEEQRWCIDLDWLKSHNRSLHTLALGSLCASCRKRLSASSGEVPPEEIFSTIRDCCSGDPDFITGALPILESAFRIFLANGNQPLDLIELGRQLNERRGIDTYRTSVEMLSRLLKNESYYGLRPAAR